MKLLKFTIRRKLAVVPFLATLLFVALFFIVYWGLNNQRTVFENIYTVRIRNFQDSFRFGSTVLETHGGLFELINWVSAGYDSDRIEEQKTLIAAKFDEASGIVDAQLLSTSLNDEERQLFDAAKEKLAEFTDWGGRVLEMAALDIGIASMFMGTATDKVQELKVILSDLETLEIRLISRSYDGFVQNSDRVLVYVLATFAALLVVTVVATVLLSRSIIMPLERLKALLTDVAEGGGDLSQKIEVVSHDEIGDLGSQFNTFIDKLRGVVSHIHTVTISSSEIGANLERVAELASTEVSGISQSVTGGREHMVELDKQIQESVTTIASISQSIAGMTELAESQAGAVVESSASIEEMAASIGSISRTVEEKRTASIELSGVARSGVEDMDHSTELIESISHSTDNVLAAIKIIDEIAQNTNLLSMNASIEAAHAGEAGKGFAVVAGEIKKLSAETAENASIIGEALTTVVESIQKANDISRAAGISFHQLADGINDLAESMEEINNSMRELSIGSAEIVKATESLTDVTSRMKDGTIAIDESATSVHEYMSQVSALSSSSSNTMKSIADRTIEIAESLKELSVIGKKNRAGISDIETELAQFRTEQ